jgi:cerevisin
MPPYGNVSQSHSPGGGSYVVILNSSHPDDSHVVDILARIGLQADHPDIHTIYNGSLIRGFCASMESHCVNALNGMEEVAIVEKARMVTIEAVTTARPGSPWGLQSISSTGFPNGNPDQLAYNYSYDVTSTLGAGVDIYLLGK